MTHGLELELIGLEPGRGARGAVLVLNGAAVAELPGAMELAAGLGGDAVASAAAPFVVAVDGGWQVCATAGISPDRFVGDGDSVTGEPDVDDVRIYPRDKDFSDLAGALRELSESAEADAVVLAGLLGGRIDHEWANLFELAAQAAGFAALIAPAARGTVVVTARGLRARAPAGSLLSLFALGGPARVSLRGTRWELSHQRLTTGSRGLSNFTAATVELTVHDGVTALVFPQAGVNRRDPEVP